MKLDMGLIQQLTGVGQTTLSQAALLDRIGAELIEAETLSPDQIRVALSACCHALAVCLRAQVQADMAYSKGVRHGAAGRALAIEISAAG